MKMELFVKQIRKKQKEGVGLKPPTSKEYSGWGRTFPRLAPLRFAQGESVRVILGIMLKRYCFFNDDEVHGHKVERESRLPSTEVFRGFMASLIDNPNNFSFSEVIVIIKPFQ
jgi:hypothetical protein